MGPSDGEEAAHDQSSLTRGYRIVRVRSPRECNTTHSSSLSSCLVSNVCGQLKVTSMSMSNTGYDVTTASNDKHVKTFDLIKGECFLVDKTHLA